MIPDFYAIPGNPEIFSAMAMCICGTLCVLVIFPVNTVTTSRNKETIIAYFGIHAVFAQARLFNFCTNFATCYWKIDTFEMCDIFCAGSWDDSIIGLLTIFQLEQRTKDASAFV